MKYEIIPVPKPRQTRSDKWKERPCVLRYRAFADKVREFGIEIKPGDSIIFCLPMSKSWSEKKKKEMYMQPHCIVPDLDNLIKSILDACHKEDSHIHWLGHTFKKWDYEGSIIINHARGVL